MHKNRSDKKTGCLAKLVLTIPVANMPKHWCFFKFTKQVTVKYNEISIMYLILIFRAKRHARCFNRGFSMNGLCHYVSLLEYGQLCVCFLNYFIDKSYQQTRSTRKQYEAIDWFIGLIGIQERFLTNYSIFTYCLETSIDRRQTTKIISNTRLLLSNYHCRGQIISILK